MLWRELSGKEKKRAVVLKKMWYRIITPRTDILSAVANSSERGNALTQKKTKFSGAHQRRAAHL